MTALLATALPQLPAATLVVDQSGGGSYTTIQSAIDAASAGDTIFVKKGVYDTGWTLDNYLTPMRNRIFVNKPLTIVGEDRDQTIVKGARATISVDDRNLGIGSDAVRCIAIGSSDVTISKLTIVGGATHHTSQGDDAFENNAGGVACPGEFKRVVVADCIVSNNVAHRAAAARFFYDGNAANNLLFVRCWIHANRAYTLDPVTRGCTLAHSLITSHPNSAALFRDVIAINCTFADNHGRNYGENEYCKFYNCLFADGMYKFDYGGYYYNCGFPLDQSMVISPTVTENCVYNIGFDHFIAPIFADFRLHSQAVNVIGYGKREYLVSDFLPEAYRYVDYYGNAIDLTAASVNLGCSQSPVTPTGGKLQFSGMPQGNATQSYAYETSPNNTYYFGAGRFNLMNPCESYAIDKLFYAYATNFPEVVRIEPQLTDWQGLFGFIASGVDTYTRYPYGYDTENYEVIIPQNVGEVLTLSPKQAAKVVYVKQSSTSSITDGSSANPYKDLQTAINACSSGAYSLIYCLGGSFSTGTLSSYGNNRIYDNSRNVRIVGKTGPMNNIIVGGKDSSAAENVWPFGCGSGSVRCVRLAKTSQISGFTLTYGHTGISGTARRGGAVYLSKNAQISDCIISNNWGCQGVGINSDESGIKPTAIAQRCYLEDNHQFSYSSGSLDGSGSGIIRSTLGAYLIYGHKNTGMVTGSYDIQRFYNCTFDLIDYPSALNGYSTNFNSIVKAAASLNSPVLVNTVVDYSEGAIVNVGNTCTLADPFFAQQAAGDYRIASVSPAVSTGGYDLDLSPDFYLFAPRDFYGNAQKIVSGRPVCGAVQQYVATVVSNSKLMTPAGTNVYTEAGAKIVYTAETTTGRPFLGIAVTENGVTTTNLAATTYVYVVPADDQCASTTTIWGLFDNNWYVNQLTGDDDNDGSEAYPKRTLRGACLNAVEGDIVHVAAGRYNELTMTHSNPLSNIGGTGKIRHPSRMVIPCGVTVEGAGAESTFIVGVSDPYADPEERGCGAMAVRCVAMEARSKLRKVTLVGGRTNLGGTQGDDFAGGGVLAAYASNVFDDLPVIEDVIITNCAARRGGGAFHGVFRRCRFYSNLVSDGGNGTAGRGNGNGNFYLFNSVLDNNTGYVVTYYVTCQNCTFGAGNSYGGNPAAVTYIRDAGNVENTLFLGEGLLAGTVDGSGNPTTTFLYNCMYGPEMAAKIGSDVYIDPSCVTATSLDELAVDANYVPVYGASIALDGGNTSRYDREKGGDTDLWGVPRVLNDSKIDVGAAEYDWRTLYSRRLGARVKVTEVSPAVTLRDEGVEVPTGATLTCKAGSGETGLSRNYYVKALVADGSQCELDKNGEYVTTFLPGTTEVKVSSVNDMVVMDFAASGLGSTYLKSIRASGGMVIVVH